MYRLDNNVDKKMFDTLKETVEKASDIFRSFVLHSMRQDLMKIDKADLVAFLVDPSTDVRALAKEEIERRGRIAKEEATNRESRRAWYRALLDRIGGKLQVRVQDHRHPKGTPRRKKRAARDFKEGS